MSFGFNQIRWDTTEKIAVKEVVVKTAISEMESGGATKILDIIADGKLMSLEAAENTARVFGRVNFKLLYTDKEGEIRGLDYFADFNESITVEGLCGKLYGKISVIDVDTSISGGIKISAAVEITLFSITGDEVRCLVDADENFYVEKRKMECRRFVTSFVSSFPVTDDYDTGTDVMKILLSDASCYLDSAVAGMDNVMFTGGVTAAVTYLADDQMIVAPFNIAFSEEIEAEGIAIGQSLQADCNIKNIKVTLTGIEGSNIIRLEAEVEVYCKAFEPVVEEIVGDIFSVENELVEKRAETVGNVFGGSRYFDDNLTGIAELPPDSAPAKNIIGVPSCRNNVAQAVADNGKVIIEGVFSATILYEDENGAQGIDYEMPYSLPFNAEDVSENDILTGVGAVTKVAVKIKRDREIEITAGLTFSVESIVAASCCYIEEIAVGDEKDVNKSAVSVFIAEEGESVWDAAKALSARPDDIKKQNPDLTEPFKEGDKIFYYRRINFEF